MTRFNFFMNTHFSSCRLIARARDLCRNRNVTIHQIPGYWDVVGISDGIDSWVAPVISAGPFFRTATGDVEHIMKCLQAGDPLPPVPDAPRRRVTLTETSDSPPPRRPRVTLMNDTQPATRRRCVIL